MKKSKEIEFVVQDDGTKVIVVDGVVVGNWKQQKVVICDFDSLENTLTDSSIQKAWLKFKTEYPNGVE